MLGKDLPPLRAAAQAIVDHGGRIDVRRDGVSVELPERLAPDDEDDRRIHDDLMGAVMVISAAVGLPPAPAGSTDLVERLPDAQIGIDGWPVS